MLSYNLNENFLSSFNHLAALRKTWNFSGETEHYNQSLKFQAFSQPSSPCMTCDIPQQKGVKEALHWDEAQREYETNISFIFLVCAM